MTDKYKEEFSRAAEAIIASLPDGADRDLHALVFQFYAKLPPLDLERLDPEQAAKAVADSYGFLIERPPGVPKIRITSGAARAVIEILNDDMPFLVDSVVAELSRQGLNVTGVTHPIIRLTRDAGGRLTAISGADAKDAINESYIRVETQHLPESLGEDKLAFELQRMLQNVRSVVGDWQAMRGKLDESIQGVTNAPDRFQPDEVNEVRDFLTWLSNRNFVFLGYIEYDFYDAEGAQGLRIVPGSELGVFRSDDTDLKPRGLEGLPPDALHFALVPHLIEITKSIRKSSVHRAVHMDYIGLKRFDAKGNVIGERRFLGLFTSSVYYQSATEIPVIRRKINHVFGRASFDPVSHDGKVLRAIIEFTPRDELFQLTEDDLFEYAMGLLSLELRPKVRLFMRRDAFERFVSATIFVPRERYSTTLREEVQVILERAFHGTVSTFYTHMTDSPLVRVRFIVATTPGHIPDVTREALEQQIAKVTYRWSDSLLEALAERFGDDRASSLLRAFATAFPKAYISDHDAAAAVFDIQKISEVIESGAPSLELFRNKDDAPDIVHLKWYNPGSQIPLSDLLPILENMGFRAIDEQPYKVCPSHTALDTVWIRDLTLSADPQLIADIAPVKGLFEEALAKLWLREMENDGFSALVLRAHFSWREVVALRAYAKYLRQINFPYGLGAMASAFNQYPAIARLIITLFHARFDPAGGTDSAVIREQIDSQLGEVSNLAEDRILRRVADLIGVTLRTNYYQPGKDGQPKPYLSFKFDSAQVPELPLPRPHAEIFVYSARVEGIHLRGGKVARGGLRWSDRRDDFRTEVLGLMKAQMVKNAVIVPVGSKGGFVLKQAPQGRDALMEEGIACYRIFLSGLLDLTDNIVAGKTVPPERVVRHDADDPYLVVAADKGTATFSDYANSVSAAYGFWLGDAFASGGSVGYDHKKMAITARGGFISVARHFREIGVDIHRQDFTVIGVGDMAGDVFGNGMLLSKYIKLVGAFNHLHIFLDPNPDVRTSFKERQRLFDLPRSSWKDYDASLISRGGGVFDRTAKSIPLSEEVRKVLGVSKTSLSPDELIRAMLLAPVDLLWNGGIGTYVKAEDETHDQVGDRANNAVRVNGRELRCKVAGEGGNLGFTQKGRIEYARAGGRINTDAIDNSAGVDCSDHEVNIKIGLGASVAAGELSLDKRDALLASMTDEVANLVLKDNRLQTQALTIAEFTAPQFIDEHARLMQAFERRGVLDRVVEFLPSDKQLAERKLEQKGLTRPELAVLLAYSKMVLCAELLQSDLPDDPYFARDLERYFPAPMQKSYGAQIAAHPLRREIIATAVTNSIVNRTGITLIHALAEDSGLSVADVARAYVVARDAFGLRGLWSDIEAQDGVVEVAAQVELFRQVTQFVARVTSWFLRNTPHPFDITSLTSAFAPGIEDFIRESESIVTQSVRGAYQAKIVRYESERVPSNLAASAARLNILYSATDVVRVSNDTGRPIAEVGALYFRLGDIVRLDWLREQIGMMNAGSHWDRLAVYSILSSLYDEQRRLSSSVIDSGGIEAWSGNHQGDIQRFNAFIDDMKLGDAITLPKLVIAIRKLGELGRK